MGPNEAGVYQPRIRASFRNRPLCAPSVTRTPSSGMPFGLFKGERTYKLTPKGDSTEFHMREEYTGPMARMIFKSIPDLNPSFKKFAAGLKAKAEAAT